MSQGYSYDMRFLFFILLVFVAAIFSACPIQPADGDARRAAEPASEQPVVPADRQPVLVELFTSEGCSSCPPADRNLLFLEKQQPIAKAEIITLAFHVDYWDRLGWKDRFSSPLYSRRQEIYAQAFKLDSNYTPQMIVDGRREFVGSDSGRASKEIEEAIETPKAKIDITAEGSHLKVKVSDSPKHDEATVYAAIAEDGISSRVERGENSGKTLAHVSVVRELKTLGVLPAGQAGFDTVVDIQAPPDSKPENLKVVVFVQEIDSKKIIGVKRLKL